MSARPRPRPRARVASSNSNAESSSSIVPTVASTKAEQKLTTTAVDDEDSHFIKSRSSKGWKKIEEIAKEKEKRSSSIVDDQGSGAEAEDWDMEEQSPRSRKKKSKNDKPLPKWTRQKVINLLSSDDDGDDEAALRDIDNMTPRRRADLQAHKRQKRQRSRSRSITPPPPLTMFQIQNAKNLVQQTLDIPARPVSPIAFGDEGDSTETIMLDPELMLIAKQVQSETKLSTKTGSLDPELAGGPEMVSIQVKWQPHPEDNAGGTQVWKFQIKRHDTFKTLFEETADEAGILVDSLIVTHNGKQLFSPSTPHTVGIWAEAELVASTKPTYEYMRNRRARSTVIPEGDDGHWLVRGRSQSAAFGSEAESDSGVESQSESGDDKFKLVLRSGATNNISLTVRPTTTCAAIVKAFLKSAGLTVRYQEVKGNKKKGKGENAASEGPRLMVDGEKLDPESEIRDADLEDGDLVEVVGL